MGDSYTGYYACLARRSKEFDSLILHQISVCNVSQVRRLALEVRGRKFESCHTDQFCSISIMVILRFCSPAIVVRFLDGAPSFVSVSK